MKITDEEENPQVKDMIDAALAVGATLRLSRLVTTDTLGEHLVNAPVKRRLVRRDAPEWVGEGLDCPFCVGFWLGVVVVTSHALARTRPRAHAAWRLAAAALAMNYVVGHLSSRID